MRLNQLVLFVFRRNSAIIHCDFFLDSLVGHGGLTSDRAVPSRMLLSYDGGILVDWL